MRPGNIGEHLAAQLAVNISLKSTQILRMEPEALYVKMSVRNVIFL